MTHNINQNTSITIYKFMQALFDRLPDGPARLLHETLIALEFYRGVRLLDRGQFAAGAMVLSKNPIVRKFANKHREKIFSFLNKNRNELIMLRRVWQLYM